MKYIIDAPSNLYNINGTLRVPVKVGEGDLCWYNTYLKVESYTEPDRKAVEDEVWEFERCVHKMNGDDYHECFDIADVSDEDYCTKYSYQEAKARYEAWLKQKDEIRVGDEVGNGFVKGTAFFVDETMVEGFFIDDDDNEEIEHFWWNKRDCKKTGRHFDEVAELLKKIRGEEE